jgi:carboxypeptidase family protein/TonB-dependent receptor-like protein
MCWGKLAAVARIAVILLAISAAAYAGPRPREIHGTVLDREKREPIEGAIVMGEHATATTDAAGTYAIAIGPEEAELVVTAPGYGLRSVKVASAETIELAEEHGEQIEITGKAPDPPRPQTYELTTDDIRILPGTGNDMLRAAQALPGVARLPYSFGGLVLRGSSPRDNAVYLDGIEVPLAFHFGGLTSFYPSNMLADLRVYNGGFDVGYGRAEGGIVTLTSREPRRDRWRTGGSVGLLDSAVYAEGPLKSGSILMGVRRSYFDAVAIAWAPDDVPLPSYLDAQVRMSFGDPTRGGRITPIFFVVLDHVATTSAGKNGHEDTSTLTAVSFRGGAPYLRQFGPLALRIVPWVGIDSLGFKSITNGVAETFDRPRYPGGLRTDVARDYGWGELRAGLDYQGGYLSHFQEGLGQPGDVLMQINGTTSLWWSDEALWTDARFELAKDRISLKPGVRLEHYGLSSEWVADPRLALRERLTDELVLRETVGRFHQPPTPGDVDPNGGNPALHSSYFDQAAIGVDGELRGGWSFSLDAFANFGQDLGVRTDTATAMDFNNLGALGPTLELLLEKQLGLAFPRENTGRAFDDGIELLVRRTTDKWFWMLAYTLASAKRTIHTNMALGWVPFELDQTHNLNLIGSRRVGKWQLGARIQAVSGTPYTPPSFTGVSPGPMPLSANLPWFFQLDVRADRRWKQCWGDVNLYIDIQNATNRTNIEGRESVMPDFDHPDGTKDIPGLPIAPFIGVEFIPR